MSPILSAALEAWLAGADFRAKRDRCKRYTYGDQWSDIVEDESGCPVAEYEYISRSGRKPLANNMIRQLVKTVIGRYRSSCDEKGIYRSDRPELKFIADNALAELDCRMLEEFLISGCAVQRVACERRPYGTGLWVDNVDPRMFFVSSYKDPRGRDISLIGMLHDQTLPEITARFAGGNRRKAAAIARLYTHIDSTQGGQSALRLGLADNECDRFFRAADGRCRLIEVWTLDCRNTIICHDPECGDVYRLGCNEKSRRRIAANNRSRRATGQQPIARRDSLDFVWRVRWFAPDGTLLASGDSPYAHGSHPFAVKHYPLTDGEIHSFVEDVIDQQRFINRLIVMIDHMLGASAKGVLLFPMAQKPKNIDWREIADTWTKANGVIPITGNSNDLPRQVVTSTADNGAYQMLSLQMKLLDNISGVSDAVAGRPVAPSTGNALYENQLRNSVIALADLIESFASFRDKRNLKAMQSQGKIT